MNCVFIIIYMVSRPKFCVEINFVGLTFIKCIKSTFLGVLKHLRCIMVWSPFLETDFSLWISVSYTHVTILVNRWWWKCVHLHSDYVKMSYGSHIKIKILGGLLLGDFKNFLKPPRTNCLLNLRLAWLTDHDHKKGSQFWSKHHKIGTEVDGNMINHLN